MGTRSTVDQLNRFLRGEMSAVESYQMALAKVHEVSSARDQLLINLKSHEDRVMMLQDAIIAAGGEPANSSGPWGALVNVIEGGAKLLGREAAIAALEEGEDLGLERYRGDIAALDAETQHLVVDKLLPAQRQTHDRLSALKHRLS